MDREINIADLTAQIVAMYVSNNPIQGSELPNVIREVHRALMHSVRTNTEMPSTDLTPAISVQASDKPDSISCLECGKKYKSLKRHLRTAHDLTPEGYRERWNLTRDYPMTASNYAAARSALAKKAGLGHKRN